MDDSDVSPPGEGFACWPVVDPTAHGKSDFGSTRDVNEQGAMVYASPAVANGITVIGLPRPPGPRDQRGHWQARLDVRHRGEVDATARNLRRQLSTSPPRTRKDLR